ncbi:DNA-binding GntR family transcriptional regulator [Labrenzia sp. EL_208]|uniref:Carbon starvation induced regulator n=1 Tax=Roseibium album TaxID=311410 RepID=A0A0M7AP17_9HYPH|nr:GntR family transcriptional regulator [Roseibium album]MBG6156702.1 DNA-binding GntR family transcriptional regulator [Labrenzia sp. EL_162]MBG6173276.1 DNA-binding GntR family transcriptional regulator [Labrenzia sp. EL_132]MBG6195358.1 DNA-binding GntR family transcriptional regulator [Labrenzia sp. EL_159]MBG6227954.1 DNA-binding GntR family transcriptional regulator [Labrenzia sp. EL_208]CTQ59820.1 Carbon starvation induced regulator [Roseibium album]
MLFGGRNSDDETVVAMLASAIRRDISFGVLPPDEKLKIEALRQAYGGSNHSMRETLRMLSAEGLVEATSQRGFRVMSATQEDLEDILLMRIQTEKLGLSRAMERGDVAWESRVVAAFHALSRAEAAVVAQPEDITALEWDEACRAASETLLSACGSRRLIQVAGKFYNQSRRFRLALLREGRIDFLERADRLERLQRAVLSRDEVSALALLEEDIRADLGAGKTTARTQ